MDVVVRAVIIYALVFAFTRALGRRELSTLQPFDLILLIVIGDLIQSGVTQNDMSVTGVIIVLCTIGSLQVLTSYWRVRQLVRLGLAWPVAEAVAGRVDWHDVAKLVQRGCPAALAVTILQ